MKPDASPAGARRRLRLIVRQGRRPPAPLFMPLISATAAQIEALDVHDFLTSPTQLSRALTSMYEITGTDGMVTFAAHHEVAEILGAGLDRGTWPPLLIAPPDWRGGADEPLMRRILAHPRLEAGLEATRRLKQTVQGEPLFAAVLAGPAALAAELGGADTAVLQDAARITVELTRAFGDAGVNLVLLAEDRLPPGNPVHEEVWRASVVTIANVARFFDALPVVLFSDRGGALASGFIRDPVPGVVAGCFDGDPDGFPEVHCLAGRPASWALPSSPCSLVTTAGEVAVDQDIAELREACLAVRRAMPPG